MSKKVIEKQGTVVIAEDDDKSRQAVAGHLEVLGFEVVGAAADGEEAVRLVSMLKPSLVVLDVKMPKMDGIKAAKAITDANPIPIILLTGMSSNELAEEALDAGVFSYLVKPVTKKQLLPAIKLAMARFDQFNDLKGEVSGLQYAMEARKFIEKAKGILMQRCKIGEEEAFKLLQTQSQKENKKMREIAEMVISASKLI
jgi:response regulator NasT